jgi:hypothetical protein
MSKDLVIFERFHLDAVGGRRRRGGERSKVGVGDEASLEVAVAARRVVGA